MDISGIPAGIDAAGNLAFVWTDRDIKIIDITEPRELREAGAIDLSGGARQVTLSGEHAYVAAPGVGLLVVAFRYPSAPRAVDQFDTPGMAGSVAVARTHVFFGDLGPELWVLESVPAR